MKSLPLWIVLTMLSYSALVRAESTDHLSVMSFNIWHDGTRVNGGFEKLRSAIVASKADLVGMQESTPETARRLAEALGWQHATGGNGSVQILSRHPIVETLTAETGIGADRFIAARIRVGERPLREVVLCDLHLDYVHYGPYAARLEGATSESVVAENGKSARAVQMAAALAAMAPILAAADTTPVLLSGDFNVPSHLDWTMATAAAQGRVGPVNWPESILVAEAGMIDSFRHLHPDPLVQPGTTWSSLHKESEPQDRIDFIYFKGASIKPVRSSVFTTTVETTLGAWGGDDSPAAGNTWPSDHAAVLTTFRWIQPAPVRSPGN